MKRVSLLLSVTFLMLAGSAGVAAAKIQTVGREEPVEKAKADSATAPGGCTFIDRAGSVEGCAGELHVSFSKTSGGVFSILRGHGKRIDPLGTVGARVEVTAAEAGETIAAGKKVVLRQENDGAPGFFYLEEGNLRCGLRVMFKLLDEDGTYYGDAMQEVWLYPSGDLYAALYTRVQDRRSYKKIHGGWLELVASGSLSAVTAGTPHGESYDRPRLTKAVSIPFGTETLPGKYVGFEGGGRAMLIYWLKDEGRYSSSFSGAYDNVPGPPGYRKWPHAIDQYGPRTGFGVSATSRLDLHAEGSTTQARFVFEREPDGVESPVNYSTGAIYAISVGKNVKELTARAEIYRDVIDKKSVKVDGGEFCFFNDMENGYEVFKAGAEVPVSVSFPPDKSERTVTLTVFGLTKHGGVAATVDGKSVPVQLASDGGVPDDPLAPVKEPPHAPAQQATFAFALRKDKPTTAVVAEVPGVQLTYQRRHPLRTVAVFSSRSSPKLAGMEFSLLDGVARHIGGWGKKEYAVTENFLYWFRNCSYSRHEYPDQLRDFVVEASGPQNVVFRYRSATFNDRVHSQYTITVPYDAPCFMYNAKARFEVTRAWASDTNQFFDMFPFRGVYPSDWWWEEVLWMNKEGQWGIQRTLQDGKEGPPAPKMTNNSFYGFYSSDRGNVLLLAKNFDPDDVDLSAVLCGNYIDLHLDVHLKTLKDLREAIPGSVYSMEYDLAVYGDDSLTRERVVEIGKKSMKANRLIVTGK